MLRVTLLSVSLQVTLWKVTRAPSEHQCPHVQSAQGNSAGRERSLSAGPEWVPEEPRDGRRGHSGKSCSELCMCAPWHAAPSDSPQDTSVITYILKGGLQKDSGQSAPFRFWAPNKKQTQTK